MNYQQLKRKDFRRNEQIDVIKNKIENQHQLLIVGESGTSKSTILMEIMCDYFDDGYTILSKEKPKSSSGINEDEKESSEYDYNEDNEVEQEKFGMTTNQVFKHLQMHFTQSVSSVINPKSMSQWVFLTSCITLYK